MSDAWASAVRRAFTLGLIASAVAAGLALAQVAEDDGEAELEATFGERVEVSIVNVDVFVTDKKGRPVSGLTAADFAVFDDGRPVEVTNFLAGGETARVVDTPPGAEAGPEGPRFRERGPRAPQQSHLILYVDGWRLGEDTKRKVLDDLKAFLRDQLGPDNYVMFVWHNLSLEVLTGFTNDLSELEAAVEAVAGESPRGGNARQERARLMKEVATIYRNYLDIRAPGGGPGGAGAGAPAFNPCVDAWELMLGAVRSYAETEQNRAVTAASGLAELTSSLAGVSGRKSLIYLSEGLQQRPGIAMFDYLGGVCPQRQSEALNETTRYDVTSNLQELAAHANSNYVTFYAVDSAGLEPPSSSSVEFGSLQIDNRYTGQLVPKPENDRIRKANTQNSLYILSDETGGRAIFNTNRPSAELGKVLEEIEEVYSLGYALPHGRDGRRHRIRVELVGKAAKGRELRFRRSYIAKKLEQELAERTLSVLHLGLEENPLGVGVAIGPHTRLAKNRFSVPVRIVVPLSKVTLLPVDEGMEGRLRLIMTAADERNRLVPVKEKTVPLAFPERSEPAGPEALHVVEVTVEMRGGEHVVAVGARDELGGVASYLKIPVNVDPTTAVEKETGAETGS